MTFVGKHGNDSGGSKATTSLTALIKEQDHTDRRGSVGSVETPATAAKAAAAALMTMTSVPPKAIPTTNSNSSVKSKLKEEQYRKLHKIVVGSSKEDDDEEKNYVMPTDEKNADDDNNNDITAGTANIATTTEPSQKPPAKTPGRKGKRKRRNYIRFDERIEALTEYKEKYGTVIVDRHIDPSLARWVTDVQKGKDGPYGNTHIDKLRHLQKMGMVLTYLDNDDEAAVASKDAKSDSDAKESSSMTEENDEPKFPVGTKVSKFFDRHGWFHGKIVHYSKEDSSYRVQYDDGDKESYLDPEHLDALSIIVGNAASPPANRHVYRLKRGKDDFLHPQKINETTTRRTLRQNLITQPKEDSNIVKRAKKMLDEEGDTTDDEKNEWNNAEEKETSMKRKRKAVVKLEHEDPDFGKTTTKRHRNTTKSIDSSVGEEEKPAATTTTATTTTAKAKRISKFEKLGFKNKEEWIMSKIPLEVKNQFRQVGFALWRNIVYPIMFVGPFDVPPGSEARSKWMKMFDRIYNQSKIDNRQADESMFSRLVYWYGEEEHGTFSLLSKEKTMSYEIGCKLGHNVIPKAIQERVNCGTPKVLSLTDTQIINGLKAINEDYKKPIGDRQPWLFKFQDSDSEADEESETSEGEDEDGSSGPPEGTIQKIEQVMQWAKEENAPRFDKRSNDWCYKCDDGGQLLECEFCPNVAHHKCVVGRKNRDYELDHFVCDECIEKWYNRKTKQNVKESVGSSSSIDRSISSNKINRSSISSTKNNSSSGNSSRNNSSSIGSNNKKKDNINVKAEPILSSSNDDQLPKEEKVCSNKTTAASSTKKVIMPMAELISRVEICVFGKNFDGEGIGLTERLQEVEKSLFAKVYTDEAWSVRSKRLEPYSM